MKVDSYFQTLKDIPIYIPLYTDIPWPKRQTWDWWISASPLWKLQFSHSILPRRVTTYISMWWKKRPFVDILDHSPFQPKSTKASVFGLSFSRPCSFFCPVQGNLLHPLTGAIMLPKPLNKEEMGFIYTYCNHPIPTRWPTSYVTNVLDRHQPTYLVDLEGNAMWSYDHLKSASSTIFANFSFCIT